MSAAFKLVICEALAAKEGLEQLVLFGMGGGWLFGSGPK